MTLVLCLEGPGSAKRRLAVGGASGALIWQWSARCRNAHVAQLPQTGQACCKVERFKRAEADIQMREASELLCQLLHDGISDGPATAGEDVTIAVATPCSADS